MTRSPRSPDTPRSPRNSGSVRASGSAGSQPVDDARVIPLDRRPRRNVAEGTNEPTIPKAGPEDSAPGPGGDGADRVDDDVDGDGAETGRSETDQSKTDRVETDRMDVVAAFTETVREAAGDVVRGLGSELLGPEWRGKVLTGLDFVRRRVTGAYEVDRFGFDRELTEGALLPLIRPLFRDWFRTDVKGIENIPDEGGALIVANHSGTLPLDGLMVQVAVHDVHPRGRFLRLLAADLAFKTPFSAELARKSGATLASADDADQLLSSGEVVGVFPEGFKGIGKPFSERYKLQRFGRGGFVSSALRAGVPIIPCSIVGAEETYPLLGNITPLARLLGLPYVPITPTFPWLGPLGLVPLPAKWMIAFGTPIPTDDYGPDAADDPMLVFELTDQVRETIQQTLYELLLERGRAF